MDRKTAIDKDTEMTEMTEMKIEPYLFFEGRCEEAIAFYREALGAELQMMMRYEESPVPPGDGQLPPGAEKKVMHAALTIGGALVMMSDGLCSGQTKFGGVSLSLTVPDGAAAKRSFDALADGGTVQMPLGETFFSKCFGMVTDRFGVSWMVNQFTEQPPRGAAG